MKFPFCLIHLPRTAKSDKRLSKIIKSEAKTEKAALTIAIKELDELQKIQKNTIKVCQRSRNSANIYRLSPGARG